MTVYGRCWLWDGPVNAYGYGWGNAGRDRSRLVHRLVYEELVGPIPEGMELDHLCRTRNCYNPAHLEPVTHAENMRRNRVTQQQPPPGPRTPTHCPKGHDMSDAYVRPDGKGRQCRVCQLDRDQRHKAKRKVAA